jgi:hypothetical protein
MTEKLLWVAKKDGTGWNSARTRDTVDVAFTLTRESSTHHATLEVRCTWYDEPTARAKRYIGRMYFVNNKRAKLFVNHSLSMVNGIAHSTKDEARETLLNSLLRMSEDTRGPGFTAAAYEPYMMSWKDGRVIRKSSLITPAVATPLVDGDMAKTIEEVQEIVEPVFNPELWSKGDPVPAGWINLGGKLTQIGWPS